MERAKSQEETDEVNVIEENVEVSADDGEESDVVGQALGGDTMNPRLSKISVSVIPAGSTGGKANGDRPSRQLVSRHLTINFELCRSRTPSWLES